ncbi:DUF2489 domain-containing protein [Flavobacterium selenitireducens]|uniref:DUF2489 domain-containing protein n=1 Tax=Flavobacterium selenitireducens TaxID=2722704 RepID=UPI00168B8436|nr:DUF2489 domain-containing protein [Flavobacterium selenitireducens]MBD3584058.1 DUF2489 domain-containing protein [Flavobacterium selenitireducens]
MFKKLKKTFLDFFWKDASKIELNKFEEIKRNRLIKKMRSNAIAISTSQIQLHTGVIKMNSLIDSISDVSTLENIDLGIFRQFYVEFSLFPIDQERQHYGKQYLAKIDQQLNPINEHYKKLIFSKCSEIIEKFSYIKNVC